MNKLKFFIISSSAATLLTILPVALADNPPSIAVCEKYLYSSDSQFNALVSASSGNAQAAAAALGSCLHFNICSSVTNVNHCAATLATRTYLSNFYANYNDHMGYPAPTSPFIELNNPSPPHAASGSAKNNTNAANTVSNNTPATNTNKSTSTTVHWY